MLRRHCVPYWPAATARTVTSNTRLCWVHTKCDLHTESMQRRIYANSWQELRTSQMDFDLMHPKKQLAVLKLTQRCIDYSPCDIKQPREWKLSMHSYRFCRNLMSMLLQHKIWTLSVYLHFACNCFFISFMTSNYFSWIYHKYNINSQ